MPAGPGIYDDLCTHVRTETKALAAIVIIVEGDRGNGFSCQSRDDVNIAGLAAVLEEVAGQLRDSVKQKEGE